MRTRKAIIVGLLAAAAALGETGAILAAASPVAGVAAVSTTQIPQTHFYV
jgi:hypothetical protein